MREPGHRCCEEVVLSDVSAPDSVIVSVALVLASSACGGTSETRDEQPTFDFLIPAGSADLAAAGQPLEILPSQLAAEFGQTIQIVNEDDESHQLGPWFLGPGETLRQRFTVPGVFEGSCSVHPSGNFAVVVND